MVNAKSYWAALALAGSAAALSGTAQARQYDIPWYTQHPADLQGALQTCRNDTRYSRLPLCTNAEAAEVWLYSRRTGVGSGYGRTRIKTPAETLNDPYYWANNRIAALGAQAECRNAQVPSLTPRQCAAASAAAVR